MVRVIVSGGQTGADQAALDFAIGCNLPYRGWISKGRLTEEGPLDKKYALQEMDTDSYPKRTEQNVVDSDGTLIVSHGKLTGGSELTAKFATKHCKPFLHIDLNEQSLAYNTRKTTMWLIDNGITQLNVAGPRASGDPSIYKAVTELLEKVLGKNG